MKLIKLLFLFFFPFMSFGQNWIEYQNKTWIQMDSSQITAANLTYITLEGCLELVDSYRVVKDNADSTINSLKEHNKSLENQIDIHEEKDIQEEASIEEKNNIIKKAEKKAKLKKIGNSILFSTFAVGSAVLMVLYLTK